MELRTYFEFARGRGILATADSRGRVNTAIFGRPHCMDDGTIAFIMTDRLTHANLQSNPHAAYMFLEDRPGYAGRRLHLTRIREESDRALIDALRRHRAPEPNTGPAYTKRYLVYFSIDRVLPLIGRGEDGPVPPAG